MKTVITYIPSISSLELDKMTFLLPYYLNKEFNTKSYVYTNLCNDHIGKFYRNVEVVCDNNLEEYVYKNKVSCDLFIVFGHGKYKNKLAKLLKTINPKCKYVIFTDASKPKFRFLSFLKSLILINLRMKRRKELIEFGNETYNLADKFVAFTDYEFHKLEENGFLGRDISEKLIIMINGYDSETFIKRISNLDFDKKENLILYTGRIGVYPKNHNMFFKIAKDNYILNGWKIVMVGPYSDGFIEKFKKNCKKYDAIRENLILTGPAKSKDELYGFYEKSKAFLLTSKSETLCFSLIEAALFRNYLITTEVGIAAYVSKNYEYCSTFSFKNINSLRKIIYDLTHGCIDINEKTKSCQDFTIQNLDYKSLIRNSFFKEYLEEKENDI